MLFENVDQQIWRLSNCESFGRVILTMIVVPDVTDLSQFFFYVSF